MISNKPTTRAKRRLIEYQETKFDFAILDDSIKNANYQLITELLDGNNATTADVGVESALAPGATVIDIRHPSESEARAFSVHTIPNSVQVLTIPFYQLRNAFDKLDRNHHFLRYCEKGMMSRLHVAHIKDEGFANVSVFEPSERRLASK